MLRVIYTFDVKPGQENEFIEAWRKVTREIRATARGSKGSLLARDAHEPTMFIGVARWASAPELKKHLDSSLPPSEAAKTMRATLAMAVALQVVEEITDLTIYDA